MDTVKSFVNHNLSYGFHYYRDFIFGLLIGLIIAWFYHKYIGNKNLKDSYERLLKAKDETLNSYKEIIGGRLAQADVEKKDKDFFNRLKKFFRAN